MRLTITLWQGLSSLPRGWHSFLGNIFGELLLILFAKRKRIAKANIRVCFPLMSSKEQKKLLKQNFNCLGCSIFETGIAWFWSDQKIHKYFNYEIRGLDQLNEANTANGNLLLFKHSQHLELDARKAGYQASKRLLIKINPENLLNGSRKERTLCIPLIKIMDGRTLRD